MTSKPLDMQAIIRYGQKIGATQIMFMNGQFRAFYKPGNKDSHYKALCFTKNEHGRPLAWTSSHEYAVERIEQFYKNLGKDVCLINMPLPPTPEQGQQHESENRSG